MAIINDSNVLASVTYNGIITFWDLKTQRKTNIQTNRHCDVLQSLAFSSDGTKFAIVHQQLIHLTDLLTGRELRLTEPRDRHISAMAVSPDGKTVAIGGSGEIRLWNTDTDEIQNMSQKDMFPSMMSGISTIIFSQDGKNLSVETEKVKFKYGI